MRTFLWLYGLVLAVVVGPVLASEAFFVRHEYAQVLRVQPITHDIQVERQRLICYPPLATEDDRSLGQWRQSARAPVTGTAIPNSPWQQCMMRIAPETISVQQGYQVRFLYRGQMFETITSKPPAERLKLQLVLIPEIE